MRQRYPSLVLSSRSFPCHPSFPRPKPALSSCSSLQPRLPSLCPASLLRLDLRALLCLPSRPSAPPPQLLQPTLSPPPPHCPASLRCHALRPLSARKRSLFPLRHTPPPRCSAHPALPPLSLLRPLSLLPPRLSPAQLQAPLQSGRRTSRRMALPRPAAPRPQARLALPLFNCFCQPSHTWRAGWAMRQSAQQRRQPSSRRKQAGSSHTAIRIGCCWSPMETEQLSYSSHRRCIRAFSRCTRSHSSRYDRTYCTFVHLVCLHTLLRVDEA